MRDSRINYILVGGFVVLMLVALAVSIALLTGRTAITDTYYTQLNNVTGLRYGTRVTFEGFVVGQVEEINPVQGPDRTLFQVRMSVRQDWPIPKDSVARVAASGLLAAVSLDIRAGSSSETLRPGSVIASGPAANLFATMNEMAGQMAQLNQDALIPLLATLNRRADSLGRILEEQAPDILAAVLAITTDMRAMSGRLERNVVTEANTKRMGGTVEDMAALASGLRDTRLRLDSVLVSMDKMVGGNREEVTAAVADLRYTLQSLARNIDSITYNLEATSRNAHEFSRQIRDNPGLLIGGRRGDAPGR